MKGKSYTKELKEEILIEVKEALGSKIIVVE